MLTTFTSADGYEDGFDESVDPPWLMIGGDDDDRRVTLLNGQGMHLHSFDPDIATAKFVDVSETHYNQRQVSISGFFWGATVIEVRRGPHIKARLHVSTYPHRVARVNFYRVKDKSGQMPIFNTSMVRRLITQMNNLHRHQTNISFVSHLIHEEVPLDLDFSTTDQSAKKIKHIWDVLEAKSTELDNSPRHYHVFWVKKFGASDKTCKGKMIRDVVGQASAIGGHMCIMEDADSPHMQGLVLAHELGHCLKAHHDKEHDSALMYPSLKGGHKIYSKTVEEIRGHLDY